MNSRTRPLSALALLCLIAMLGHAQSVAVPKENIATSSTDTGGQQQKTPSTKRSAVSPAEPICGITQLGRCIRDLGDDEKGIFTSPLRAQPKDAYWLMPLGAATGCVFAYDAEAAKEVGVDPNRTNIANNISNFGSFYATGAERLESIFSGSRKRTQSWPKPAASPLRPFSLLEP